jgi:hypothetical protein
MLSLPASLWTLLPLLLLPLLGCRRDMGFWELCSSIWKSASSRAGPIQETSCIHVDIVLSVSA